MDSSKLQKVTDFQNLQPDSGHTQAQEEPSSVLQGQALPAADSPLPATPPHHDLNAAGRSLCRQQDEQFFNFSLDLLSVGSLDEGYLQRVNPAWTACLGWSATELTSRPWLDFVHPDDHAITIEAHEQLLQGKTLHEFENRYRCKDGSHRQLSWNVHPDMDSRQLFCIARDVTAHRHNEALLRRNDELFRLMVEGSEQVVFYTRDKAHRFTYVSPSLLGVMGYQPAEVLGKTYEWLQMTGDPLNFRARETLLQALKDGQAIRPYTIAARHKDGHRVVLEIIESPVFEGSDIVSFQGFARDLTERMRTQNELEFSELRFRGFFEQAAVGMVVRSETGEFVRVNQRFADIIGYTQEEIVGQLCSQMTHADDREHEAVSIAQLLHGHMASGSWEKRYIHKNGSAVWCTLSVSLLSLQDGGTRQLIGVVEDISEKKRVQENLQRSQALLRIAGASAKLGGWILEMPGNVLRWSDEVRAIHEVAGNFEPTLAQALEYYPEDYRDAVIADLKRCQEEGVLFSSEYELTTATGKRIWVLAMGEAMRDAQGAIVAVQGAIQDISARKQTEASLQASQRRFREIADTFPFIVWTAEPDGRVEYVNHVFSDHIGLAQDNNCGVDWLSCVHPEDIERCINAWQTAVQTGCVYSIDYRLKEAASGDHHWHRLRAAPVRDASGQVIKWYGTAIDINETKSLEQQSKSFANRLNTTLESITDGFFILDKNWAFAFLNTQAERMLGRSRGDMLGKTFWLEFPPAPGTVSEQEYLKAIKEGVPVHFQDYYPPPLDCWFAVSAYPSDEGLAVYFRDVTQTRKDIAQLQLLRTAVSRLNDIVLITEAEPFDEPGPRIIFVNEAFERRTGYTQAEVIGKTPRILQGPKTQRAELDRIGKALKAWQPVRGELINYTKSGEEFWLELDIVPIADSTGWFTHWVSIERDITERKMAQEAILQLNSELEDRVQQRTEQLAVANKELEAFSYSVSHDLRSPLATINGFSQLLLKSQKDQLSEKGQHYLNRIYAGSTKMGELIEGLLSLAKLSRGDLNRQDVDLTAMTAKMVRELRDAEPDRVVDVTIQADLVVNGDAAMVTVIMQNLVSNAWKYSGKTPLARVEIGSETTPDGVRCIFVRDNGAGFDMAYAEKLFQVFQRLHQDTEFKGTGIGLANVQRVVERHGGRVWAQAAVGKGATFRFTLNQVT